MPTTTSKDGTRIAFDQSGTGPVMILVVGAFNGRATGVPLARALEAHFTVFNYDRRGRGESGDTQPYAIEREIEDLDALIAQAGGSAFVFGYSSGAILALRAAAHGSAISHLALYDPPPTGARAGELVPELAALIAAGQRGEAVELFQTDAVGIPAAIVAQMRNAPFRPALEKIAHTLIYESTILQALPTDLLASVPTPTLVIDGEQSHPLLRQAAHAVAAGLPNGEYRTLPGQGHDLVPSAVMPVLEEFLLATRGHEQPAKGIPLDKAELLKQLRQAYQQWEMLLAEIGPARMNQPGVNGADWSVKDIIAHLTGWNRWLVARFQAAQRGTPEPLPAWPAHLQTDDEINAWIYDSSRGRSLQEVLDETQQTFQQLLATIEALPDDVRIERVEPRYNLVWIDEKRFLVGEFFDHFRDDHEPDVRAWLARTASNAQDS